jgi:hypothetical protein
VLGVLAGCGGIRDFYSGISWGYFFLKALLIEICVTIVQLSLQTSEFVDGIFTGIYNLKLLIISHILMNNVAP